MIFLARKQRSCDTRLFYLDPSFPDKVNHLQEVCSPNRSVKRINPVISLPSLALLTLDHNSEEKFNAEVFRRLGELGLLGVTVPPEYGGSGMDASAACIVHEELSAADPAFCLSYLGKHSGSSGDGTSSSHC